MFSLPACPKCGAELIHVFQRVYRCPKCRWAGILKTEPTKPTLPISERVVERLIKTETSKATSLSVSGGERAEEKGVKKVPLSKHPMLTSILQQGWTSLEYQYFIDLPYKDRENFIRKYPRWEMHFPLGWYGPKIPKYGTYVTDLERARVVWVCYEELAKKVLEEVEDAYLIVNDLKCPICGETRIKFENFIPQIRASIKEINGKENWVYKIYFVCGHYQECVHPLNLEAVFHPRKV